MGELKFAKVSCVFVVLDELNIRKNEEHKEFD